MEIEKPAADDAAVAQVQARPGTPGRLHVLLRNKIQTKEGRTMAGWKTICDVGKCPTCGKQYLTLKASGLIVMAACEHAWKLGPKAETKDQVCEICDQDMIFDATGQVCYATRCTCYRDDNGNFACDNPEVRDPQLMALGAEIVYLRSQLRQVLVLQKAQMMVMQMMTTEERPAAHSAQQGVLPARDFRCPLFLNCEKASGQKKACKDEKLSLECAKQFIKPIEPAKEEK